MKWLRRILLTAAALVLLCLLGVIVLVSWSLTTVARLEAGHGINIRVVADTPWHIDPIRAYYYEVHRGFSTVVPTTFIGTTASDVSFELRTSSDKRLIALIEGSAQHVVLAIFDTVTSETWPRGGDTEQPDSVHQRGVALLARLQQSHPGESFVLGDGLLLR